jgi:hypothetical protein
VQAAAFEGYTTATTRKSLPLLDGPLSWHQQEVARVSIFRVHRCREMTVTCFPLRVNLVLGRIIMIPRRRPLYFRRRQDLQSAIATTDSLHHF